MPGSGLVSRFVLAGMQTGVLGLAFWAFWAGPVQAPGSGAGLFGALASSDDASRIPLHARFDRKTRHVAESWRLFGDLQQEDATGTRAEDAAEAEALVAHARAALEVGPASGHAWLALAWGEHLSGRDGPARAALETSWRVAPSSRNLAFARVWLGSLWWADLGPEVRQTLLVEMDRARSYAPEAFAARLADDPRFAALWRLARARGLTPAYSAR